jgi:hypothetical protein
MVPGNPMSTERRWVAALIAGHAPPPIGNGGAQPDALLDCAIAEGVVALVHQRLGEDPGVFADQYDVFSAATRAYVMESLLREAECKKVLEVLGDARIPVLLMKGSALAWWLYPSAFLRECVDVDLLFSSREQAKAAAGLLAAHGYVQNYPPDDLSYELLCRRQIGVMNVDLDMHWRLVNVPFFAEMFGFEELQAASIPLPRLAANARGLGPVHAFLHACSHRAVNLSLGIGDRLKWLYDLHLLAEQFTMSDWSVLEQHCREHGLSGVCAAGIEAAAEPFGSVVRGTVLESLREASKQESLDVGRLNDWKYMQARNLAALPSLRVRARWLWQRVFPPKRYMQELYGVDRSAASLWMQRMKRAVWRLRS